MAYIERTDYEFKIDGTKLNVTRIDNGTRWIGSQEIDPTLVKKSLSPLQYLWNYTIGRIFTENSWVKKNVTVENRQQSYYINNQFFKHLNLTAASETNKSPINSQTKPQSYGSNGLSAQRPQNVSSLQTTSPLPAKSPAAGGSASISSIAKTSPEHLEQLKKHTNDLINLSSLLIARKNLTAVTTDPIIILATTKAELVALKLLDLNDFDFDHFTRACSFAIAKIAKAADSEEKTTKLAMFTTAKFLSNLFLDSNKGIPITEKSFSLPSPTATMQEKFKEIFIR